MKLQTLSKRPRRILVTLFIAIGLAVLVLAVGAWQNYSWVHRPLNRYEDELPLYGIVATGETAIVPKETMRQIISTADILYEPSPLLQETRWYRDMMRQIGSTVTLTPEDIFIIDLYATNDEDRQQTIKYWQGETIEVAYNEEGGIASAGPYLG